jgi:integrase
MTSYEGDPHPKGAGFDTIDENQTVIKSAKRPSELKDGTMTGNPVKGSILGPNFEIDSDSEGLGNSVEKVYRKNHTKKSIRPSKPIQNSTVPGERVNTDHGLAHNEGANVPKRGRPSNAEKQARRGKSMGRYPLMTAAELYLERRSRKVSSSTMVYERRKVRFIVGEIESMREQGKMRTSNPKEMGADEIRVFLDWMRDAKAHNGKGLDPDTQVRYLRNLEGILDMNGNKIVGKMRDERYLLPQKTSKKPIRAMTEENLKVIQDAALKVGSSSGEPEGWRRAKARFISTMYVATGLRPSELRVSLREDLDVNHSRFYVRTPKGDGVWAVNRTVTIMPPCRKDVVDFLQEREKLLQFYGRDNATYLIPYLRSGEDRPYSENHFRELKKDIQEIAGVDFKLKDFRPTFATMCVAMDPNLLVDVSAQLGHSNVNTTQRYYAQISAESAGSRLEKAWDEKENKNKTPAKPESGEALKLLSQLIGMTQEELVSRLSTKATESANIGIESKNLPSG